MAISAYVGSPIDKTTNTFDDLITRVNSLSSDMGSTVITSGNNNSGDIELNGDITANSITIDTIASAATLALNSDIDVTGTLNVSADFDVNGIAQFDGDDVNIYSTNLTVTAATTFGVAAEVDIQNKLLLGGNNYVYGTANGTIAIWDDFMVGGTIYLNGSLVFANNSSDLTIGSDLTVGGYIISNGSIVSNNAVVTVGQDLHVNGAITSDDWTSDGLNISGYVNATTLTVTANSDLEDLNVSGMLDVVGATTLTDLNVVTLTVSANSDVEDLNVSGILDVTGDIKSGGMVVIGSDAKAKNFLSLSVGNDGASTSDGDIVATGDITAFYSDERLKDFQGRIPNAIDKVNQLNGYYWTPNKTALKLGVSSDDQTQVGVNAQEVQKVLPEVIKRAAISDEAGVDYLTLNYDKLVPLLIEAIKEQNIRIDELESKLN